MREKLTIHLNGGASVDVEVLPCPFCNSSVDITHIGNNFTRSQSIKFKCSNSKCRVQRVDKVLGSGIEWVIPRAVESWNLRGGK